MNNLIRGVIYAALLISGVIISSLAVMSGTIWMLGIGCSLLCLSAGFVVYKE